MLKIVAIAATAVVAVAVLAVLILAVRKPDSFRVERSATVKAPPEAVFALLVDFRRWVEWSPWEHKDPALNRRYGEPAAGAGATYAWEGNKDVGKGGMRITKAETPSLLVLDLDFEKPFEAHNQVRFTLTPKPDGTEVLWSMEGPTPFFAKIIHVFIDMDRMVGGDFEAGLAKLKASAEK